VRALGVALCSLAASAPRWVGRAHLVCAARRWRWGRRRSCFAGPEARLLEWLDDRTQQGFEVSTDQLALGAPLSTGAFFGGARVRRLIEGRGRLVLPF